MKTQLLNLTVFLLLLCAFASSCNPEITPENPPVNPRIIYPIDIALKEYSLAETNCKWINMSYDERVIILDSKEELEKYIECKDDSYPEIDFSKNTLLLVSGANQYGIHDVVIEKLEQIAQTQYKMYVRVRLNFEKPEKEWICAMTINKLYRNHSIELIQTTIAFNAPLVNQPLEVIQATVLGKWHVSENHNSGVIGSFPVNTIVDIFKDKVVHNPPPDVIIENSIFYAIDSFNYTWIEKPLSLTPLRYTFIMQPDDFQILGWSFGFIRNDRLYVNIEHQWEFSEYYVFVRIDQ